jgi:hypothetical protein
VLPLVSIFARRRAASALIIGSMIPDLAYFVPWSRAGHSSHSAAGLLMYCLPWGLLAAALFEWVVREPLAFLLPAAMRSRLGRPTAVTARSWPVTILAMAGAVIIGSALHMQWDALANRRGVLLDGVSWARMDLATIGGYRVTASRLIDHAGTLVGGAAIAWTLARWMRSRPARGVDDPSGRDARFRRMSRMAIGATLALGAVYGGARVRLNDEWLQVIRFSLYSIVIWTGRAAGVAALAYAAVWWARVSSRRAPVPSRVVSPEIGRSAT